MSSTPTALMQKPARRQAGVAAVELAIILPILMTLLAMSIFFGRMLMYYTVSQKSAQSAIAYVSSVPRSELAIASRAEEHVKVAQWMADEMMGDINDGNKGNSGVVILCEGRLCGMGVPKKISVIATTYMFDDYFNRWTRDAIGPHGLTLDARANVTYAAN